MTEPKVAAEVALAEFNRMCGARRIDLDESDWDADDKKTFNDTVRKPICAAISQGKVTVDANGDPTFTFGTPPIKLGRPKGSSLLAMDGKIGNARVFAALADISGMAVSHFANFELDEIRVIEPFFVLFFAR